MLTAFDLSTAKEGNAYRLRGGDDWRFLHLGYISKNVAVGETNDGPLCLFADGRYRMDDQDHNLDIVDAH